MNHFIKVISLVVFLIFIVNSSSGQERAIDWQSDLNFLKEELQAKHVAFEKLNHESFISDINSISENLNELTNLEVLLKIQQALAKLGDSHTYVDYGRALNRNKKLPVHFYWFKDGLYILHASDSNKDMLGKKLLRINGFETRAIIDSLATLLTVDNDAILKKDVPGIALSIEILEFFGIVEGDSIGFELTDADGATQNYLVKQEQMSRSNRHFYMPDSLALSFQNERALFWDNIIGKNEIYYIQYNKCWSREFPPPGYRGDIKDLPSFSDFQMKVLETIRTKDIKKIVIDLRNNSGGNSSQANDLIKDLSELENARIYVILGRKTFSSAILNALDLRRQCNAVFVGEETAGKPNHFGEVKIFTLPSSGIKIYYSTKYFQRVKGDMRTLTPDYTMDASFEDFKKGIDPALEYILKQ